MNSLSWLIYLADVLGSIDTVAWIIAVISSLLLGVVCLYGASIKDCWGTKFGDEEWQVGHNLQKYALTKMVWIPLAAALLAVISPSSTTIYAIAASEVGEEVVKSETANKAMKALNNWIDRQIAPVVEVKKEG